MILYSFLITVRMYTHTHISQVIWSTFYTSSSSDHGSLGQLFALLRRLPAAKKPKNNMNACTEVIFTVFKGYILAYTCKELGIDDIDSDISLPLPKSASRTDKLRYIVGLGTEVMLNCTIIEDAILGRPIPESGDGKYNYTRTLCHYVSLALELFDGWHNGDGIRDTRCWRVLLPHFFATGHTKYALEAVRLQMQLASLPPRLVHQITWGRFVNTHGGLGHNQPCDFHNEHVNKLIKEHIKHMGSNFSQKAITNVARSVSFMEVVTNKFDQQCGIHAESSAHSTRSDVDDVKKVVSIVLREKLWDIKKGRKFYKFKTMSSNPLKRLNRDKLTSWMTEKIKQYKVYRQLQEGDVSDIEDNDSSTDTN